MGDVTAADVVVIGAGLSGLACARRLADAGAEVVVVEARARVGGRALTAACGGGAFELGAQWLSPGQDRLAALVAELGVPTVPQRRDGQAVLVTAEDDDAGLDRRGPGGWWARRRHARALRRVVAAATALAARVPPGAPARTPGAAALDAQTVAGWLAATTRARSARRAVGLHCALTFAVEPEELSLLGYLAGIGATGGFGDPAATLAGGARELRLVGGAQGLCARLAAPLGARVRLGEPVTAVAQDAGAVRVHTRGGAYAAARAVLALPPAQAAALAVTPAWPAPAAAMLAASRPGAVVKCVAVYRRPFWRDAGLSGEAYLADGTVTAVVDGSAPGDAPAALLAMVVAAQARRWHARAPDERRGAVLAELAALFGPAAATPTGWLEHDWAADPWSGGCVATTPPGALAAGAAWRAPHGRLHVAGTESAVRWPGYLDGALEAGERAAAEVLAAG